MLLADGQKPAPSLRGAQAEEGHRINTCLTNACFRRDIGWSRRYPTYREGLDQIVTARRAEQFPGGGKQAAE